MGGVRRYQDKYGRLTPEGKERYYGGHYGYDENGNVRRAKATSTFSSGATYINEFYTLEEELEAEREALRERREEKFADVAEARQSTSRVVRNGKKTVEETIRDFTDSWKIGSKEISEVVRANVSLGKKVVEHLIKDTDKKIDDLLWSVNSLINKYA